MTKSARVEIIGGGLAGCEAAWRLANSGVEIILYEMKPRRFSPAHKSAYLAELVCSNSLRSKELHSAVGILKEEMKQLDSIIMEAAAETEVPAGRALAVDRGAFSRYITEKIENHITISVVRKEIEKIERSGPPVIIATGPLTSKSLADEIRQLIGEEYLYFFDAISPIVTAESLDMDKIFRGSRYEKNEGDYLNCPLSREEYEKFVDALLKADTVPWRSFEQEHHFEGCLPIEVMARRGRNTLLFGPMKPVGLKDPRTGQKPYAVVQLRPENRERTLYNMVGFQTRLKYDKQEEVFRMIPGLKRAEFIRYGSMHRNTYINAPKLLDRSLRLKTFKERLIMFAGQITGVEGYVESAATGILAGIFMAMIVKGHEPPAPPVGTAHRALIEYLVSSDPANFKPSNINFGIMPQPAGHFKDTRKKREAIANRALHLIKSYKDSIYPICRGQK